MNTMGFVLAVGLLGASVVQAQSVSGIALDLDCPLQHLPSQRAIGNALGVGNFSEVYAARARLLQTVQRDCLRGAQEVRVVDRARVEAERKIAVTATVR